MTPAIDQLRSLKEELRVLTEAQQARQALLDIHAAMSSLFLRLAIDPVKLSAEVRTAHYLCALRSRSILDEFLAQQPRTELRTYNLVHQQ